MTGLARPSACARQASSAAASSAASNAANAASRWRFTSSMRMSDLLRGQPGGPPPGTKNARPPRDERAARGTTLVDRRRMARQPIPSSPTAPAPEGTRTARSAARITAGARGELLGAARLSPARLGSELRPVASEGDLQSRSPSLAAPAGLLSPSQPLDRLWAAAPVLWRRGDRRHSSASGGLASSADGAIPSDRPTGDVSGQRTRRTINRVVAGSAGSQSASDRARTAGHGHDHASARARRPCLPARRARRPRPRRAGGQGDHDRQPRADRGGAVAKNVGGRRDVPEARRREGQMVRQWCHEADPRQAGDDDRPARGQGRRPGSTVRSHSHAIPATRPAAAINDGGGVSRMPRPGSSSARHVSAGSATPMPSRPVQASVAGSSAASRAGARASASPASAAMATASARPGGSVGWFWVSVIAGTPTASHGAAHSQTRRPSGSPSARPCRRATAPASHASAEWAASTAPAATRPVIQYRLRVIGSNGVAAGSPGRSRWLYRNTAYRSATANQW